MEITAVVPAYNEAQRIKPVLEAITQASLVDDILVVSDGSSDDTYEMALEVPGVRAIELANNIGKAGAMVEGAQRSHGEVIVFLDADLIGLKPAHVDRIVNPVKMGEAEMCVGLFRGGRFWTDLAQRIAPVISGQRAIRKDLFLGIPDLALLRMGVEIALTKWARYNSIKTTTVVIEGVTHPMKEEKLGKIKGFSSRMRMYCDIGRVMMDGRKLRNTRRHIEVE